MAPVPDAVHRSIQADTTVEQFRQTVQKYPRYRWTHFDRSGCSAIHRAATVGNAALIRFIALDPEGQQMLNQPTLSHGLHTPLMLAIQNEHVAATDALIDLEANVHASYMHVVAYSGPLMHHYAPQTPLDWIVTRPIETLQSSDAMRHIAKRLLLAGAHTRATTEENRAWFTARKAEVQHEIREITPTLAAVRALRKVPIDVLNLVTGFAAPPPVDRTSAP